MDLFDVVRSCARRWYICLPLLLIAAWFSYGKYSAVQPAYYSQAVIGFAGPSSRVEYAQAGTPISRNGLLDAGGADLIANMTALGLREPAVIDAVVSGGGLPDYSSRMFPTPPGSAPIPLVMIEETGADPAAVTRTLELIVEQSTGTVENLQKQAGVAPDQMATPLIVMPPTAPSAAMPSRTRSTATIFVAGAGLTVVATVLADILLGWLAARRRQSGAAAEVSTEHSGAQSETPTNDGRPTTTTHAEGTLEPR
ncbi:hypothetical protein M2272_002867 [Mycobacterium frederiksbergense]|uniref:Capsular polysaccharide biosynthesis protein n=1 Tax=Mycolicibacterium frederiksbergense TaxID=117567 RepID=A0ABT6KZV5_9MYCO|nr:hypothetical protein [Mycolicibacterium frederiksbergense]MDH6196224.1 hypothetical protein [Mycolicibacterium frederiksbergense]